MHLPKCLTFDDVLDALVCRRCRVAGVIGINLLRNKLSATNSVRRSKFDGHIGLRLEVAPDPTCWGRIHEGWDAFAAYVTSKNPPPLSKGDVRQRDDSEWTEAAEAYIEARRAADQVQRTLDAAKGRLTALTSHSSEAGSGATVTRYWRRGSTDCSPPTLISARCSTLRESKR